MSDVALIAIDWGTTSARAYAVDGSGLVLDCRAQPLGIQKVTNGDFPGALARLLGDWLDLPVPRLACGMIGSRQGWVEAPYAEIPASPVDLAASLARTPGGELSIVPGLIGRDGDGVPDVMRGEETQIAGAVSEDEPSVLVVLPGTHSKWALVERGRVARFVTHMTGELYSALLEHTILGRLARLGHDPSIARPLAFDRGVRRGLSGGGLARLAFGARTLALTGELEPEDVPDWLSGLLIGLEIADARSWASSTGAPRLIGAGPLVDRYAQALRLAGLDTDHGPEDAAALGLVRIARLARIIQ